MRAEWLFLFLSWLLLALGCATVSPQISAQQTSPAIEVEALEHAARMQACVSSLQQQRALPGWQPEYLSPRQQDRLEHTLAEYLACRRELQRLAPARPIEADRELSSLCREDHVLHKALNQAFHRSAIPAGSCDQILDRKVSQTWVTSSLSHTTSEAAAQVQRGKSALMVGTCRLKNPVYRPLDLTPEQRQEIRAALQPGDVLLTYTAGFVCNYFIPGHFKHAITFVGTEAERRQVGCSADRLVASASPHNVRLAGVLAQSTLPTGEPADAVESMSEGVLLNNVDRILAMRINRLVVLRPRLTYEERAEQLADVLSYVGDEYDFNVDLADASDQVCTEVVYRSLQGRGGIDLPLTPRAGRFTLTADDILHSALQSPQRWECLLSVEENREAPGQPRVMYGSDAKAWATQQLGLPGD